jgi:tellurite resistance protein TerC
MGSLPWIGFVVLVVLLLALDLGVLNRRPHAISAAEALRWTVLWVGLALTFNVALGFMYEYRVFGIGVNVGDPLTGKQAALQFFTAYVVEESLSIDNLFVMALVFRYLAVPALYQHRVLFFGILGALVFRGLFIGAGLAFIHLFTWAVYVFGALLLYTAVRMLFSKEEDEGDLDKNLLVRILRLFLPVTTQYEDDKFFTRLGGKIAATPLCVALMLIESSDIVFAVDSVPAVFGVTGDPFIAFTSNVFAILGLRSLYFALAAALHSFRYIKVSLVLVLAFVGAKMLLTHHLPIGSGISLGVILALLGGGVIASLVGRSASKHDAASRLDDRERSTAHDLDDSPPNDAPGRLNPPDSQPEKLR